MKNSDTWFVCVCCRCGDIDGYTTDTSLDCDCGSTSIKTDIPLDDYESMTPTKKARFEQQLREQYTLNSTEYDETAYKQREQDDIDLEEEEQQESEERVERESKLPKCPTCNSTDVKQISGLERGASVLTLGLFSKKINKSFKCGNCRMTF